MSKTKITEQIFCSFCGCAEKEIDFLVEGNNAFICDTCIDKAREALTINNKNDFLNQTQLLKPQQIKNKLDKFIIGQEKAKMTLSVGVYNPPSFLNTVKRHRCIPFLFKTSVLIISFLKKSKVNAFGIFISNIRILSINLE